MASGLTYADAAKLLDDNRIVGALDRLAGGALLAAAAAGTGFVLSLFDPKAELAKLSTSLVKGLRDRLRGASRPDRSERIAAGHSVLVVAAYFESLVVTDLPFDVKELGLTKADQRALAAALLHLPIPLPAPETPYEDTLRTLTNLYQDMARPLLKFIQGLAVWDTLDETRQDRLREALLNQLPRLALARYEDSFRRLAVDFPEVAFWANLVDHQATRAELRHGLAGIERALAEIATGRAPDARRLGLAREYQSVLRRPILRWAQAPGGVTLPELGDVYVNPDFRAAQSASLAEESMWRERPVRHDLQEFLLGHLTLPQATQAPLLVLGQPGSGKSVLTQILAARLAPNDFLVVRVVLREMPADIELQDQIERAIRSATGENLTWPELVRSAGDALPVVLLDGFDELLQATGVNQSDYLERVANFQRREAIQGRPVAVVVTSRTVVADRARPVPGMVAIRLEPFAESHVRQWLDVWNAMNSPLPAEAVLAHADLASQPLLLLLLALYHAEGYPLHRDDEPLDQSELYERLLTRFAEREVRKTGPGLSELECSQAIDQELLRLSVVAFAMFNRKRQWVSEADVDTDLAVLVGPLQTEKHGLRAAVTPAEDVIGKFFFIYQAQALRDDKRLKTFEFLHATFGEYLIARLVAKELADLVAAAELNATRTRQIPIDDAFLHAVLSFAALSTRYTVLAFLDGRIQAQPLLREVLLSLFHRALKPRHASQYDEYEPDDDVSVPARYAVYSANLLLLIVCAGGPVSVAELFPDQADPIRSWRKISSLWRSQLSSDGWLTLIDWLMVTRGWDGDRRTLVVESTTRTRAEPFDPGWAYCVSPSQQTESGWHGWLRDGANPLRTHIDFVTDRGEGAFAHALEPLSLEFGNLITTFFDFWQGRPMSPAHALISLWTAAGLRVAQADLAHAHETCLRFAIDGFAPDDAYTREVFRKMYLTQLATDIDKLPKDWVQGALERLLTAQGEAKERAVLAQLTRQHLGLGT